MQLPPPVTEQLPAEQAAEKSPAAPEQAPAAPERASTPVNQAPAMALPPVLLPVPPQAMQAAPPMASGAMAATAATSATAADDGDLIEKEWVNKAKQIVEKTRDDPYKQSEELTLVKVDYMKKRYGKALKINQ